MDKQVVYEFQRNKGEKVCVSIGEYREKRYIDLRVFFSDPGSGELKPTKKGITLESTLLPQLRRAVMACEKYEMSEPQQEPEITRKHNFTK